MPPPLPPSRLRRVAKWVGVSIVVLLLLMWGLSTAFVAEVGWRDPLGTYRGVWLGEAYVSFDWVFDSGGDFQWRIESIEGSDRYDLFPPFEPVSLYFAATDIYVNCPIWLAAMLATIPTAILWRRDRRTVKPGRCVKCDYDLRASKKVCPECGMTIATAHRTVLTEHSASYNDEDPSS